MENKKGQAQFGMVTGLIFGVASLVIAIIIAFVITSTLSNADLIGNDDTNTFTVTNESVTASDTVLTYEISAYSETYFSSWSATLVMNGSTFAGDNVTLVEGVDYSIQTTTGTLTNLSDTFADDGFRVTYNWVEVQTFSDDAVTAMTGNFTSGVDNVSDKLPTVLLIAAIVLILSILAVLVAVWQRMRFGGGSL